MNDQTDSGLPADIAAYIGPYYEASFDEFPEIPKARMKFGADHRPEFTRAAEETRRIALYDGPLDGKTAQLVAFGYLLNATSWAVLPSSLWRSGTC